jgi:hypothetical protein
MEITDNKRVIYTANYGNTRTLIEVNLVSEFGRTTIKLRQEFNPGQDFSSFNQGWNYFLGILEGLWENGFVRKDCDIKG